MFPQKWRVYNADRTRTARCSLSFDATLLVGAFGEGACVEFAPRRGKRWKLWQEGRNGDCVGESRDAAWAAAHTMVERMKAREAAQDAKRVDTL